jgi:hypothetical protein
MDLVKFLEKAAAEGITTVSALISAINAGTCDSWESFQKLDRQEAMFYRPIRAPKARR